MMALANNSEIKCKGMYFRGSVTSFLSSYSSVEVRKSLRFLKRMSCSGCPECEWVNSCLGEELPFNEDYLETIKHGKLYRLKVQVTRGYFDSYPEFDYIDFEEIEETGSR